jgi:hypothetical protein
MVTFLACDSLDAVGEQPAFGESPINSFLDVETENESSTAPPYLRVALHEPLRLICPVGYHSEFVPL